MRCLIRRRSKVATIRIGTRRRGWNAKKGRHGDKLRRFCSYRKFVQTEDGREVQMDFWRPVDDMRPENMALFLRTYDRQVKRLKRNKRLMARYWDTHVASKFGFSTPILEALNGLAPSKK
jgi:hypothetical protein